MCIRAKLTEKVTMLIENKCNLQKLLVYERYVKSYDTRAKIIPVGYAEGKKIYSIIIPMPPAMLSQLSFTGVLWNGSEYVFTSPLKIKGGTTHNRVQFLCGTIKPVV